MSPKSYAVEITGPQSKIKAVIDILKPIGIQEIVRTGEPQAARRDQLMDGRVRHYQSLLLPLATDGRTVDKVMVGTCFELDRLPLSGAN